MKQRNIFSGLCIVLTVGSCLLAGCADADEPLEPNTEGLHTSSGTAESELSLDQALPSGDYQGYQFRILNNLSNFAYTNFGSEGQTGEALDDAIYERNNHVEERLNIRLVIEDMVWEENKKALEQAVLAAEDRYDIYFNEVHFQAGHAVNGYLHDLTEMTKADLTKPWWNKSAVDSLTIGERRFFLYGDLHTMFSECIFPVAFNKTILNSFNLEDPYALVADNQWTLDTMSVYMKEVSKDLNGDGQMDTEDQYGLTVFPHNALGFVISAESSVFERDEDNLPYWNGLTPEFESVYMKVREKLFSDRNTFVIPDVKDYTKLENGLHTLFAHGQVLFYAEPLGSLKKFRDVEFEVGVVPMPKLDETQKSYRSYVFHGAAALAVPKTNGDLDRTGTVVENLCAYSYDIVRPIYFDETLDFKYIQDEEGQKMLDLIFSDVRAELGRVYDWGGFVQTISERLTAKTVDLASFAAKRDRKIQEDLAKTLEAFRNEKQNP